MALERPRRHRAVQPDFLEAVDGQLPDPVRGGADPGRALGITREEMDAFAAREPPAGRGEPDNGHFASEIVPVPIKDEEGGRDRRAARRATRASGRDEHARVAGRAAERGVVGPATSRPTSPPATRRRCPTARRPCSSPTARPPSALGLPDPGASSVHLTVAAEDPVLVLSAPNPGDPEAARALGHDDRRLRRHRVQRGLRRHRPDVGAGVPARHDALQPARRRHRHRPPARRQRRAADDHAAQPPRGHRRPATASRPCARAAARPTPPSSSG